MLDCTTKIANIPYLDYRSLVCDVPSTWARFFKWVRKKINNNGRLHYHINPFINLFQEHHKDNNQNLLTSESDSVK